jgi:hypothetical protein
VFQLPDNKNVQPLQTMRITWQKNLPPVAVWAMACAAACAEALPEVDAWDNAWATLPPPFRAWQMD